MLVPKLVTTFKSYDRAQFVSDLTAGITVGIVALPLAVAFSVASGLSPGGGAARLGESLAHDLPAQFDRRILPVDERVARAWGGLTAEGDRAGRPLPVTDGLLLATAQVHGLTLVTRNTDDVGERGVAVFNPYRAIARPKRDSRRGRHASL